MRLVDLLQLGVERLHAAGVEEAETDSRVLLEHSTGLSRTGIFLNSAQEAARHEEELYFQLLQRREKREPIAYILGEQEFWSLPFKVTPDVLIPRPETEFLLELVLQKSRKENLQRARILDLCCGSGVIAVVLAKETGRRVLALDCSLAALAVAKENVQRHGCASQVDLLCGDLLSCFMADGGFSLIVSNPPYITAHDLACTLQPEVAEYEPYLALDGGEDGADLIRRILDSCKNLLLPGGELFVEIGADQGGLVAELFQQEREKSYFSFFEIVKDYADRDRVLHAIVAG